MVKKYLLILLLLALVLQPSFGLEPRIIQQGDQLSPEEVEGLDSYLEALEKAYDMEAAIFILENPSDMVFDEYIDEAYELGPRYVYFAIDLSEEVYHSVSDGIDELTNQEHEEMMAMLMEENHQNAFSLFNGFFMKVNNILSASLMPDNSVGEEPQEVEEEETSAQVEVDRKDALLGDRFFLNDSSGLWNPIEQRKLAKRMEDLSEKENIFLVVESLGESPSLDDYADQLLEEFSHAQGTLVLLINQTQGEVGFRSSGRASQVVDQEKEKEILGALEKSLSEGKAFEALSSYLDQLEGLFSPAEPEAPIGGEVLSSKLVHLEDLAGLWSEEEARELFESATSLAQDHEIFVTLATTNDSRGKSSEAYIDDLADETFGINTDNVAFLIDMQNRRIHISTSGRAIDILDDKKIEKMLDHTFDKVADEDYFGAGKVFMKDVDKYFVKAGPNKVTAMDALAGLGLGGAGGLGFFTSTRKRYSKKASPLSFQYTNNILGGVRANQGALINRRVTTRTIPSSSSSGGSSGGGSTTHTSSGGGRHGGGGRSF